MDLESKEIGYRGFVDKVLRISNKLGIKKNPWASFIKATGFHPLREIIYKNLDFIELLDYYLKNIYPVLKREYKLKQNQAPKKEQISKDYSGFITALRRKGYNLTDLHLAIGFEAKYLRVYANKSYSGLIKFFKKGNRCIFQPNC